MATFVDVPGTNGQIKTKAVCRAWQDGKQIAKCKTFQTKDEARKWAFNMEKSMKKSLLIEKLNQNKIELPVQKNETLGDVMDLYFQSSAYLTSLLDVPVVLLGVNKLVKHFEDRLRAGATLDDIQREAELLSLLFRFSDRKNNRKDSNLVAMALTAVHMKSENLC